MLEVKLCLENDWEESLIDLIPWKCFEFLVFINSYGALQKAAKNSICNECFCLHQPKAVRWLRIRTRINVQIESNLSRNDSWSALL